MKVCQLIDRTPDSDINADLPIQQATQIDRRPSMISTAQPVIYGQEPTESLEDRSRFSTASRLTKPADASSRERDTTAEYNPNPVINNFAPTAVKAASFELPPIVSAEEARELRARRGN